MLHMGFGPLVLNVTTNCCNNAFNLKSIFDFHHAELNETMGKLWLR